MGPKAPEKIEASRRRVSGLLRKLTQTQGFGASSAVPDLDVGFSRSV
jgi:hypothetical protein